jgi:hypothetical protein
VTGSGLPGDEHRITALRDEIRRAGARLGVARSFLWRLAMFVPVTMAALELYDRVRWETRSLGAGVAWRLLNGEVTFLALAASAAGCVAVPLVAGCRAMRRAKLRERLAVLAPAERAAVLLPLRADRLGDTRKLIEPLLRGVVAGALEVVPATSGDGRGDEPCPVDCLSRPAIGSPGASKRRSASSARGVTPVLRCPPRAGVGLLLSALPLVLLIVPLVPSGPGVICGVPGTSWAACIYNARSSSLPNEWETSPPPGFSKVERMIFTTDTVRAYRLRVGDSVYQLARWCNMDCGPLPPGWWSESFNGDDRSFNSGAHDADSNRATLPQPGHGIVDGDGHR